jgi:hypothetical protein
MTLTTFVLLNGVLAACTVYALVLLLAHGIRSDREARRRQALRLASLAPHERDRIAA